MKIDPISTGQGTIDQNPLSVLILSMQKTATLSVYHSLQEALRDRASCVQHAHYISMDAVWLLGVAAERAGAAPGIGKQLSKALAAWRSLAVLNAHHVIVTLVRDPMARLYSDIFHKHKKVIASCYNNSRLVDLIPISRLFAERAKFLVDRQKRWFREQLGSVGVDILQAPRPIGGFSISTQAGRRFAIMRVEELEFAFSSLLRELDAPHDSHLCRQNAADMHGDPRAYHLLRALLRPAPQVVDSLYSQAEVKHCYLPAELENFRSKWDKLWNGTDP
jgi:hypothetical protein